MDNTFRSSIPNGFSIEQIDDESFQVFTPFKMPNGDLISIDLLSAPYNKVQLSDRGIISSYSIEIDNPDLLLGNSAAISKYADEYDVIWYRDIFLTLVPTNELASSLFIFIQFIITVLAYLDAKLEEKRELKKSIQI